MAYKLKRIREAAEAKGMSLRGVAAKAGLSNSAINEMLRRNTGNINNLLKIAKILDIDITELVPIEDLRAMGLSAPEKGLESSITTIRSYKRDATSANSTLPTSGFIPLLTFDFMGESKIANLLKADDLRISRYLIPNVPDADYIVAMPGKAMIPDYMPGDMLICKYNDPDKKIPIEYGMSYIVEVSDNQYYVRRVMPGDSAGEVSLISPNPDFPKFSQPLSEIISFSKIVAKLCLE